MAVIDPRPIAIKRCEARLALSAWLWRPGPDRRVGNCWTPGSTC